MDSRVEKDFRKHAEECYPKECCGLEIIFKGRNLYVPCSNIAKDRQAGFIISPEDYADAEELGEIISVLHSHPDASSRPSEADRVSCENTGLIWYVVSVSDVEGIPTSHDISKTSPSGYKAPLIGREFSHGVLDCYALIKDWYQEEQNITLPEFKRPDDWWNDGESDLYRRGFPEAGFISAGQDAKLEVGDVILMQIRSKNLVPNHAGIYIGNNMLIHHMYGRLSSRDMYGSYLRDVTTDILKYKG